MQGEEKNDNIMKKQGFTIDRPKSDTDPVKITFSGDLSINSLEDIIPSFTETLAGYSHFRLIIKDVETLDLAFMQFVLSARKTAEQLNKKIELSFKVDEETKLILIHSGFAFLLQNNVVN